MGANRSRAPFAAAAGTAVLLASALGQLTAQPLDRLGAVPSTVEGQQPSATQPPGAGGRGGGRGGGIASALFGAADTNKDGALTREEFRSAFDTWFTQWDAAKV